MNEEDDEDYFHNYNADYLDDHTDLNDLTGEEDDDYFHNYNDLDDSNDEDDEKNLHDYDDDVNDIDVVYQDCYIFFYSRLLLHTLLNLGPSLTCASVT